MSSLGINTVRTYTPPRRDLLDEAARHGLRVMVGLPWSQHVAFLDDRRLKRAIRHELVEKAGEFGDHPAVLMVALGNEIPPGVVRWHGRVRVERFLRELYQDAKTASPESLFTYVNFPPTEFLDLSFFDVCAFNVYLHREPELRAYLARLQHIAGHKPLLLAEAGADSIREGEAGQADITAMHVRAAFEEGACGAIAFAWTDEWWRGGHPVDDWAFGLVDRHRHLKPAALAVASAFEDAPFARQNQSVVAARVGGRLRLQRGRHARRLPRLARAAHLSGLRNHPRQRRLARSHRRNRPRPSAGARHRHSQRRPERRAKRRAGRSERRNRRVHGRRRAGRPRLAHLPRAAVSHVGRRRLRGPNVVPADDPPMAQCIARAPGGPTHVLLDDRIAEHVPGCNMAFRREALLAIGGFNPALPPRRRRCGCVLAAAGARLEDRLRVVRRSSGITIARR